MHLEQTENIVTQGCEYKCLTLTLTPTLTLTLTLIGARSMVEWTFANGIDGLPRNELDLN